MTNAVQHTKNKNMNWNDFHKVMVRVALRTSLTHWHYLVMLCFVLSTGQLYSQPSSTYAGQESVVVTATVNTTVPRVTLSWPSWTAATAYNVYRRTIGASWPVAATATLSGTSTGWADNTAANATPYEYKVVRTNSFAPTTAYGYCESGMNVPATSVFGTNHYRGKIVLVVAANLQGNPSPLSTVLANELETLRNDLRGDGWVVVQHVLNGTETPIAVRNLVIGTYNADAANVKAVLLLGNVPVPYSGNIMPDGHGDHQGAWPCDGYYGEMNGTWTDATVNNINALDPRNHNIPGDGKFDQDFFPSAVELEVGRIDLSRQPQFTDYNPTHTEEWRMKNYLNRLHAYKVKAFVPTSTGVVFDNFNGLSSASNGYRNVGALVGPGGMTTLLPAGSTQYSDQLSAYTFGNAMSSTDHLWSYACGGGQWTTCNDVSSSDALANNGQQGSVFSMMFGSYFGDWDADRSLLKAPLAAGKALTNVWAGQPYWFFHNMNMGRTIGQCTRTAMNNAAASATTGYLPRQLSPPVGLSDAYVHVALMGDPSLRMNMVAPPSNLVVAQSGANTSFSWTASPEAVNGYHIYRIDGATPVLLNSTAQATTTFTSTEPYSATKRFMVRAAKLHTSTSGRYWNLSLGAIGQFSVPVKVTLKGPYDSGTLLMGDGLRSASLVPLLEPYTALGYPNVGSGGETATAAVLTTTGSNAIVDWVRVELRNATTPSIIVATRNALLQRDGDVVSTNGTSNIGFNVPAGNYYVAVRHRNHLGAMTGAAIALSNATPLVNFNTVATWGTGATSAVGAVNTLHPGNTNNNTSVMYTGAGNDRDPILALLGGLPNNVITGYYLEDVTMDGLVKYTGAGNDRDPILVELSGNPNGVLTQQLP